MSAPKRPYVRPRVGHSMLRSLWYLFAFAGILVVAFLIPDSSPPPSQIIDGAWKLESSAAAGGLPAGTAHFLVQKGHYALRFNGQGDPSAGMEMGEIRDENGHLVLQPLEGTYLDASGRWGRELPAPRRFTVRYDGSILVLEDPVGAQLTGEPAVPES